MTRKRRPKKIDRMRVHEPQAYQYLSAFPELGMTQLLAMVYQALVNMRIAFWFAYNLGDSLATRGIREQIRPHFYIPSTNTAIIVQGGYWFDDASRLQSTALTIALMEYNGIKVLFWGEPEIRSRGVVDMVLSEPHLRRAMGTGRPLPTNYSIIRYRDYYQPPPRPLRRARRTATRTKRRRR